MSEQQRYHMDRARRLGARFDRFVSDFAKKRGLTAAEAQAIAVRTRRGAAIFREWKAADAAVRAAAELVAG